MGTVGVVSLQDLVCEREEIEQSALSQGRADHRRPVSFAQDFVANMRVGDFVIASGRARSRGDDPISPLPADLLPLEHDPKGAKEDIFKLNGIRLDTDSSLRQVDDHLVEFIFDRDEITQDVACRKKRSGRSLNRELTAQGLQLSFEPSHPIVKVLQQ
jgi:hypothetical protein